MTNNIVIITAVNPQSTSIKDSVVFQMFVGGYLAGQSTFLLDKCDPVLLGLVAISSSLMVGSLSNLTLTVNRANPYGSETTFFVGISPLLYNTSAAMLNSIAAVFPINFTITSTTQTVVITNLINLKYIPKQLTFNVANALTVWSTDSQNSTIATTSYSPISILPVIPVQGISYSFIRSITDLNTLGSIQILYSPKYP